MDPYRYNNTPPHGMPCHPHHHGLHHPVPGGRTEITGRIELNVRYIDHHGHTKYFTLKQGEMYYIKAISQTKGICTFTGKIIDFDTVKGIEKILEPPHMVKIGAIIVDHSTDYEAKRIRIGVENIIEILPIETPDTIDSCNKEDYFINNPFIENNTDSEIDSRENTIITEEINDPFK